MLHAIIVFAAEEAHEKSHTAFYVAGGILAAWALLVSFIGIRGHEDWPANETAARGVMGISTLLVVAAMATAVLTS